jgi:hypothetical protein
LSSQNLSSSKSGRLPKLFGVRPEWKIKNLSEAGKIKSIIRKINYPRKITDTQRHIHAILTNGVHEAALGCMVDNMN